MFIITNIAMIWTVSVFASEQRLCHIIEMYIFSLKIYIFGPPYIHQIEMMLWH